MSQKLAVAAFVAFPSLSQSILSGGDQAYGDFADRFVIIPNPMYGSWQGNQVR
jgi:predicted secreted acid phosphatase